MVDLLSICKYNVYRWINDNLIDKLIVLMIRLIIIELGIVIIDKIDGIMVYGGNRMGSIEWEVQNAVFKILAIVKNYSFECLMMVFIIIGIIYGIFNWYGSALRWI